MTKNCLWFVVVVVVRISNIGKDAKHPFLTTEPHEIYEELKKIEVNTMFTASSHVWPAYVYIVIDLFRDFLCVNHMIRQKGTVMHCHLFAWRMQPTSSIAVLSNNFFGVCPFFDLFKEIMSLASKTLITQLPSDFKIPLPFRKPKLPMESQVKRSRWNAVNEPWKKYLKYWWMKYIFE